MSPQETLDRLCRDHGVLAVYLFGSRADDGLRVLQGDEVPREGPDLEVGVVFRDCFDPLVFSRFQKGLQRVFSPLEIDLIPLQNVDALTQFSAIDGHRVAVTDPDVADRFELAAMSMAEEMLWLQRQALAEDNERWLHTPEVKAELDEALAWAADNPPRETDLAELEKKILRDR
jgi:predicted nucleotidyltransferase